MVSSGNILLLTITELYQYLACGVPTVDQTGHHRKEEPPLKRVVTEVSEDQ